MDDITIKRIGIRPPHMPHVGPQLMISQTRWSILVSAAAVLVVAWMVLTSLQRSNCGGNSAALAACDGYIKVLQLWAAGHDGQRFHLAQADSATRHELGLLHRASGLRSARLLARLADVRVDPTADRRIIMVCDRPHSNVPQRVFGSSPMTHAVAYSTGETGLISPEEFARLDLTGFVDLQTLAEATNDEQDGPRDGSQPIRSE